MTTLENRPNTALLVVDVQNGVVSGSYERDAVVANIERIVALARREQIPVIWVQDSDGPRARGSDSWEIVPNSLRSIPNRISTRSTATPSRTPPSNPSYRVSESGNSSSSAPKPMHASARHSTARSSGDTTRPLSAMPTQPRTRLRGGHRLQTRSLPTRTCIGPIRRHRDGRPRLSRPRMSISARLPETGMTPCRPDRFASDVSAAPGAPERGLKARRVS